MAVNRVVPVLLIILLIGGEIAAYALFTSTLDTPFDSGWGIVLLLVVVALTVVAALALLGTRRANGTRRKWNDYI